ncbi:N-acetyltransferase domain-containing protein [Madurella fahalii]|uniref:N-acetyltransferase domain-containing protein n=1 Tax=Madurella fahalii TaxID=1157608 RepID=A0ABQ0G1H6_9PEZI
MPRAQQPSIRSFFQPRSQPAYAAPPSGAPPTDDSAATKLTTSPPPPPPPPAPPLPPTAEPPRQPPSSASVPAVVIPVTLPPNGIPVLPPVPSLPSGASIVPLAEQHIPALRRINSLLLPVAYPDSFYAKALDPLAAGLFSRAILWQDSDTDTPKVIGGLICRLEQNPFVDAQGQPLPWASLPAHSQKLDPVSLNAPYHAIYIQSLALLSPYRSLGLAAAALDHIIASAALLPAAGSNIDARTIYAHVWTENEDGLKWYQARGFARHGREPVKGYYFKLRPDTAWVVRREIGTATPSSLLSTRGPAPPSPSSSSSMQSPPSTTTAGAGAGGGVVAAAVNLAPMAVPSTSPSPSPSPVGVTPPPSLPPADANGISNGPPRRQPAATNPSSSTSSLSFQNTRPETEWNDLPADMVGRSPHLSAPSGPGSSASSRSSSTARKKKERAYPSAAFGN